MSSPPLSDAIFLFPVTQSKTRRFDVDSWADYALRESSYALSTAAIVRKITHYKSTKDVAHEFLIIDMVLQQPACTTSCLTDRGPTTNNGSLSPFPSVPPATSGSDGSCGSIFAVVDADDRVYVPQNGVKAKLQLFALSTFGKYNEVCTLDWPRANSPLQMSAAQLAVLLRTVHAYNDQYAANGPSCYWYAYIVMEVIRTEFSAVQTEGSVFTERSTFARKKMDVEGDVEAVRKLYNAEWTKCTKEVQQRADAIRVNEENASAAAAAHEDRRAKVEAERKLERESARRNQVERDLEQEAARRHRVEQDMEQVESEREREKERAEKEEERANRLEAELWALRETQT